MTKETPAAGRIVMCGCHVGGEPVIRALLEAGHAIAHFVCLTPEQGARYAVSGYYDYRGLAEEYGIPVYHPKSYALNAPEDRAFFAAHPFDLLVQGGWQRLFPEHVLSSLRVGAVGIHGSADFLPKGRGRSPMNWSLIEGKKRFVMQLFLIRPGVDDGDVFDFEIFEITPFDDIETLYFKYSIVFRRMLLRNVSKLLAGEVETIPQVGEPSYYPKRTPADGRIDWEHMDVWAIHDFIRAQTRPYPGAFGRVGGETLRIWRARVFDTKLAYRGVPYGECVERFGERLVIHCRGGLLLIDEWEPDAAAEGQG
ncbi:MAG: hypothetical protein KDD82_26985 [Planctomycetes bacterium]|nr:hypothetical protein [Planctomycetota bacterium]